MKRPRLEAIWWSDVRWPRLARALEYSARIYNPDWDINVRKVKVELPNSPLGIPSHSANTAKMTEWKRIVEGCEDGERVLLIDADTMVLRSLTDVWDQPFDMAYTVKPKSRFPFNSGVVFLRVGPKARRFVNAWEAENVRLLNSPREHQVWRAKYGGVNQAALGAMLENEIVSEMRMEIAELHCREWNNEDSHWTQFLEANPRIVHLKSGLRQCAFTGTVPDEAYRPIVDRWQGLDRAAAAEAERRYQERRASA